MIRIEKVLSKRELKEFIAFPRNCFAMIRTGLSRCI